MEIAEIKEFWVNCEEELTTYKKSQLEAPRLFIGTVNFLLTCGLPFECAPFLNFDDCEENSIPTPNQVFGIDVATLNDYLWIGSNGNGDPICIDLNNNNEIVYLNHDNNFERIFINSSIKQLAESLIVYRNFVLAVNASNDSNYIEGNYSTEAVLQTKQQLFEIDNKCVDDNTFWSFEFLSG